MVGGRGYFRRFVAASGATLPTIMKASITANPHIIEGIPLIVLGSIIFIVVVGRIKLTYPTARAISAVRSLLFLALFDHKSDRKVPAKSQP